MQAAGLKCWASDIVDRGYADADPQPVAEIDLAQRRGLRGEDEADRDQQQAADYDGPRTDAVGDQAGG